MRIKRSLLAVFVVTLLVASVFGTVTGIGVGGEEDDVGDASLSGGSVAEDAIEVEDWHDLNETRNDLSADYVLMNDLNESTEGYMDYNDQNTDGWEPIGDDGNEFNGTFDGQGNEIKNLYINRSDKDNIGLFGMSEGKLENISVVASDVKGQRRVGGLVGYNGGMVINSSATGNVRGEYQRDTQVGGLVGRNSGTVKNSYARGDVSGDNYYIIYYVGGLVGYNEEGGTVKKSYATGKVNGDGYVGGLVGRNYGTVVNSYATGDVPGEESGTVGGLVGYNVGKVNNSYSTGDVSGRGNVGGLVGQNDGMVNNSYAVGEVSNGLFVKNNGGLVGINYKGMMDNSFWDVETSGIDESDGGTGLTTDEMVKKDTFTDAGWDFEEDWRIIEEETYPFLRWQEEETRPYPGPPAEDDEVIGRIIEIPGFTTTLLLIASIIAVAIYRKKKW